MKDSNSIGPKGLDLPPLMEAATTYWIDTMQLWALFADTLRQRGNTWHEQASSAVPHVLSFDADLILDGRTLARPVNYLLVRIKAPKGVVTDRTKRPFIVFDPRAGHGPGIGGMKQDSEIGVALKAGHPCYFVGFLPEPVAGQTIEDVCIAEATFIEKVIDLEPEAESRPCLIGNCQAGWQIMLTAAVRPDLAGPIILAGSPLSYWAGVRGKSPMRYLGGLLGGTWMTSLAGDLGGGIFDGADLIANFESMNPANTHWQKPYNVFSQIDSESARFLDFETWWGSPVLLNAGEMQWIADNLFVGNKLTRGEIVSSQGKHIDLRNITSPVVVFCSWGDEITPPPQALGWVLDLYDTEDDLVSAGQTIVYTVHQTIGHLGIFVSGKVATKEHSEFASCIDLIDILPPGLYEAVITEVEEDTARPELIDGRFLLSLQPRKLADIRAFGRNDPQDEKRFKTAARVSEINKGLYQTLAAPVVKAAVTQESAEWLRRTHPHRVRFSALSDQNPFATAIKTMADAAHAKRTVAAEDNPFRVMEGMMSDSIGQALKAYGEIRDFWSEQIFLGVYGSPVLQAMVGLRADPHVDEQRAVRDVAHELSALELKADLERDIGKGDLMDAVLRAALYVAHAGQGVDERALTILKEIGADIPKRMKMGHDRFKAALRKQFLTLRLDEERAMASLPALLPSDEAARGRGLEALKALFASRDRTAIEKERMHRVTVIFEGQKDPAMPPHRRLRIAGGTA